MEIIQLRVESGEMTQGVDGRLLLKSAGVRAVARGGGGRAAELAFVYRGPARNEEPLASGELRRQIGLKLLAQDTCNVVYVMWHIAPSRGIHASVKANPGAHDHASCGDRGYHFLRPTRESAVAAIVPGERHTLAARIEGNTLRVHADGALAWEGELAPEAAALAGPIGVRSDNGEFEIELREKR